MDIEASNWNEDDASNTAAAPDGAPEGMAPSGVNNVLRAIMGALKRRRNWNSPRLTSGTSTAYALSYGVAPGALVDGVGHLVQFHAVNGNAPTLNVNSLGALPLQYYSAGAWRAVPASLFDTDTISRVTYNASAGVYRLLDVKSETGIAKDFAGATVPAGYLLSYGQAISRTAYVGLFTVLGTTHGPGDGSTTFNLPDLRGRAVAGRDDMGGSNIGRLSAVLSSTTLGAVGGAQTESAGVSGSFSGTGSGSGNGTAIGSAISDPPNVLDGANAGASVSMGASNHTHVVNINIPVSVGVSVSVGGSISGSTSAVTNVQPTIVLNKIIAI